MKNVIAVGSKVYWNDPDEGISSGIYTVAYINADDSDDIDEDETIISIYNESGTEAEVLARELEAL
jgi:hypothetical protein